MQDPERKPVFPQRLTASPVGRGFRAFRIGAGPKPGKNAELMGGFGGFPPDYRGIFGGFRARKRTNRDQRPANASLPTPRGGGFA
jgi:hypothetical protein